MLAILLGLARFYLLGINAQFDPPGGKSRKTGNSIGCKGNAIIGSDPLRQAVFVKESGMSISMQ